MKIKTLLENFINDPNKSYLYLERYVNLGSKIYSPFADQTEADYAYQPTNPIDIFEVPCLEVPKEHVFIYQDNPNQELLNFYMQEDIVLFPIHPEMFQDDQVTYIKELKHYPKA